MEEKILESIIRSQEILRFRLDTGEECEATPVRTDPDGVVYVFIDCLQEEMHMNPTPTTEGGYKESFLRGYLNNEVLSHFPDELTDNLVPVNEWGDLLTIPSKAEIFGENGAGPEWPIMKQRRNRIAFQGLNGQLEWYWLRDPASSTAFANVHNYGFCYAYGASNAIGIRPAFKIKNP